MFGGNERVESRAHDHDRDRRNRPQLQSKPVRLTYAVPVAAQAAFSDGATRVTVPMRPSADVDAVMVALICALRSV